MKVTLSRTLVQVAFMILFSALLVAASAGPAPTAAVVKRGSPSGTTNSIPPSGPSQPAESSVPNGSKCSGSTQCADGRSFCKKSVCETKSHVGTACYKDNGCFSGQCLKGKCIKSHSVKNGKTCRKSAQCHGGSYCRHGKCDTVKGKGARCYKDAGCSSGLCSNKRCT